MCTYVNKFIHVYILHNTYKKSSPYLKNTASGEILKVHQEIQTKITQNLKEYFVQKFYFQNFCLELFQIFCFSLFRFFSSDFFYFLSIFFLNFFFQICFIFSDICFWLFWHQPQPQPHHHYHPHPPPPPHHLWVKQLGILKNVARHRPRKANDQMLNKSVQPLSNDLFLGASSNFKDLNAIFKKYWTNQCGLMKMSLTSFVRFLVTSETTEAQITFVNCIMIITMINDQHPHHHVHKTLFQL